MRWMWDRARALGLPILFLLAGAACQAPQSLDSSWGIPPQEPREGIPASLDVVVIADNQFHHLYGEPVWLRSGFTDRIVPVAIRPVQLDFYAPALLRWIVRDVGDLHSIVHLGDALNAACLWEWQVFVETMSGAGKGWVMAPGNHDSFYFGNGHFSQRDWRGVCDTGDGADGRMTKDRLVESYLRALADQGMISLPESLEGDEVLRATMPEDVAEEWPADRIRLEEVAWRIDRARPWRSFVVQSVNITVRNSPERVIAVLLDTSQFAQRPTLIPGLFGSRNAGISGAMGSDQIAVVEGWLARGQVNVVMGHHPYDRLTRDSREAMDRWRAGAGVAVYVSAHTHRAQWFVHKGAGPSWLELNLGSTTDWPPEYRTLFMETGVAEGKVGLRARRQQVADRWDADCAPEWEVEPGSRHDYIRYRQIGTPDPGITQDQLMDTLLATHAWLLRNNPSADGNTVWPAGTDSDAAVLAAIDRTIEPEVDLDAKVALARSLRDFEENRALDAPEDREQFKLCQAMWASKYDLDGARAPHVNDAFILAPKE